MANTKISALTSATTPLAGTEVLPIVQSSATVKVATNDLTVRNIRAAATTGILQVSGPSAASTRTVTVPDANFTAARTDAAQSFTGDQTLSTGNVIQGTAAKGFNFTANSAAAGKTSQLLNWYEEGTWTPGQGAGIVLTGTFSSSGAYTRIGNLVYVKGLISGSTTVAVNGGSEMVTGLPYTALPNSVGSAGNAGYTTSFNIRAISTALYAITGTGATASIAFSITYQV